MSSDASQPRSIPPSTIAAQYETLRSAALGEALPIEARSGLMLFLRRGMWAWARVYCAAHNKPLPTPAPSSYPTAFGERSALIHVFAAMAMNDPPRRVL